VGFPQFGIKLPGKDYVFRPSAYVVIRNQEGAVAVVRTPVGVYLPGGGQDPGESPEDAAIREAAEECGLLIALSTCLGVADQFALSDAGDAHFAKYSTFYRATIVGTATASEPDHEMVWLTPEQAQGQLTHESHRWALTQEEHHGSS
jgi:8-oxo-dGTP diphosphatase